MLVNLVNIFLKIRKATGEKKISRVVIGKIRDSRDFAKKSSKKKDSRKVTKRRHHQKRFQYFQIRQKAYETHNSNTPASKTDNDIIILLWQLQRQCNSSHNKLSSLSNTAVWPFPSAFVKGDVVDANKKAKIGPFSYYERLNFLEWAPLVGACHFLVLSMTMDKRASLKDGHLVTVPTVWLSVLKRVSWLYFVSLFSFLPLFKCKGLKAE